MTGPLYAPERLLNALRYQLGAALDWVKVEIIKAKPWTLVKLPYLSSLGYPMGIVAREQVHFLGIFTP